MENTVIPGDCTVVNLFYPSCLYLWKNVLLNSLLGVAKHLIVYKARSMASIRVTAQIESWCCSAFVLKPPLFWLYVLCQVSFWRGFLKEKQCSEYGPDNMWRHLLWICGNYFHVCPLYNLVLTLLLGVDGKNIWGTTEPTLPQLQAAGWTRDPIR